MLTLFVSSSVLCNKEERFPKLPEKSFVRDVCSNLKGCSLHPSNSSDGLFGICNCRAKKFYSKLLKHQTICPKCCKECAKNRGCNYLKEDYRLIISGLRSYGSLESIIKDLAREYNLDPSVAVAEQLIWRKLKEGATKEELQKLFENVKSGIEVENRFGELPDGFVKDVCSELPEDCQHKIDSCMCKKCTIRYHCNQFKTFLYCADILNKASVDGSGESLDHVKCDFCSGDNSWRKSDWNLAYHTSSLGRELGKNWEEISAEQEKFID